MLQASSSQHFGLHNCVASDGGGGGSGRGDVKKGMTIRTVLPSPISLVVSVDVKHHVYLI